MGKGGDNAGVLTRPSGILADPVYAPFLDPSFDTIQYASASLTSGGDSTTRIRDIRAGIDRLEEEIRAHLASNQDALVGSLGSLTSLEAGLERTSLSVAYLRSLTMRVRADVSGSASRVRTLTTQGANMRATIDLLQHTAYRLRLLAQLRSSAASAELGLLEAASAARVLFQIQSLDETSGIDISEVALLREHEPWLRETRRRIIRRGEAALSEGLSSHSQADMGSGLQIFFNLGTLPAAVRQSVAAAVAHVAAATDAALDARALRGPNASSAGGAPSAAGAEGPWDALASALAALRTATISAWHLEQVLVRKRDAATGAEFLEAALAGGAAAPPVASFWAAATGALEERFAMAAHSGPGGSAKRVLCETLEASYPRLAALLEETAAALRRETRAAPPLPSPGTAGEGPAPVAFSSLLDVAAPLMAAYLAASEARLREALVAAIPGPPTGSSAPSAPSNAAVQRAVAQIHEELKSAVSGGPNLAGLVASASARALRSAADRARRAGSGGPETRSVAGSATVGTQRNAALCCALGELLRCLAPSLVWADRAGAEARAELERALSCDLPAAQLELVLPTMRAASEWVEAALVPGRGPSSPARPQPADAVAETSPAVQSAIDRLAHVRREILSRLSLTPAPAQADGPTPVPRALAARLAARTIESYVRQASLTRPLDGAAALQAAKDVGELEAGVAQSVVPLDAIPGPVAVLRAFRKTLFEDDSALETALLLRRAGAGANREAAAADDRGEAALPQHILLHILVGRAPASVPSPYVKAGLSFNQYSLWLDAHTDAEAVAFIVNGLAGVLKQRGEGPETPTAQTLVRVVDALKERA